MKKLFLAAAIAASLTACYSNGPSTERSARPNAPTGTPDQPTTLATTLRYAPGTAAARAGDDADPGHQGPSYPWHADGIDSRLARNADNYLLCARAGAAEACAIVTPLGYMDGLEMQTDVGTDGSTALLTFQPASGGHGFSDDDNGRIDAFNKRLATVAAQLSGQLAPRLRSAHPGGSARGLSDDGNDEPDTDSDPAAADDAGNNIPMVNVPGNLPDPGGLPPDPDIPVVEVPGQRPPPPEPPYGSGSASFGEPSLRSQNCVAFWMPGMPTPAQSCTVVVPGKRLPTDPTAPPPPILPQWLCNRATVFCSNGQIPEPPLSDAERRKRAIDQCFAEASAHASMCRSLDKILGPEMFKQCMRDAIDEAKGCEALSRQP